MFAFLHALIFGTEPARFESQYPLHESVSRLHAEVTPRAVSTSTSLFNPVTEYVEGAATAQNVWICRATSGKKNAFKPMFTGSFELENGKVFLIGNFGLDESTKMFVALIFGLLTCAAGVLIALALWGDVESIMAFYPPAGMVLLVGLIWLGRIQGQSDVRWISDLVRRALGP